MSQLELFSEATEYMYFNLERNLFQSKNYREQILSLFKKHWFKGDIEQIDISHSNDFYKLNSIIENIRSNDMLFKRLFHYPLKRTGNAEVLLFLLINNSYLSSARTSGKDIIVGNDSYEVKNCRVSRKYKSDDFYFSNFKLGNSLPLDYIINEICCFYNRVPKGSEINKLRDNADFLKIEEQYRNIAFNNYFKNNNIVFIDKNGVVQFSGQIKKEQIYIDTITEGTIKPMIKREEVL